MKKNILFILLSYLVASLILPPLTMATNYYAGKTSTNIHDNALWFTTSTGTCTGSSGVSSATALSAGNVLYANGCNNILIDSTVNVAVTLSNKTAQTGYFGLTTSASPITLNVTALEASGQYVLDVSGNASGNPVATIVATTMTGGVGAGFYAVNDRHTSGTVDVSGNVVGGTSTAYGYAFTGATGAVTIRGTMTGVVAAGFRNGSSGGTVTLTGTCVGSDTTLNAPGCSGGSAGKLYVIGNIIDGIRSTGVEGTIIWQPGPTNYRLCAADSSYTTNTIDSHAVVSGPVTDGTSWNNSSTLTAPANIQKGKSVGTATGTMGSGGGAWSF
jgi:hypothetical protein